MGAGGHHGGNKDRLIMHGECKYAQRWMRRKHDARHLGTAAALHFNIHQEDIRRARSVEPGNQAQQGIQFPCFAHDNQLFLLCQQGRQIAAKWCVVIHQNDANRH